MSSPDFSSTAYAPDRLLAGHFPVMTRNVTLTDLGGVGALTRGTVLGLVTASGKYGISDAVAVDGSQVPRAILVQDSDPSGGDIVVPIYETGEFNQDSLVYGNGHTATSVREDLRAVSIFLRQPISA